ncbi:hypothetical protein HOG21_06075 [bacterium]|nr:hypothetical protein [bacterium]
MKKSIPVILVALFLSSNASANVVDEDMNNRYGSMEQYIEQNSELKMDLAQEYGYYPDLLEPAINGEVSTYGLFPNQKRENTYYEENIL